MSQKEGNCDKDDCAYFAEWEMRKGVIFISKTKAQEKWEAIEVTNMWNVEANSIAALTRCPVCIHFRKLDGFQKIEYSMD